MSRAYNTGGHTKVVERWIRYSAPEVSHSVLLTRGSHVPETLLEAVKGSNGEIRKLNGLAPLTARAKKLRMFSREFAKVVLHVHMDDILPSLAFAANWNVQNISHFNHADHRFWVGSSLAGEYIEMRTWGKLVSLHERGIHDSRIVGIPIPEKSLFVDKNQDVLRLRREMDIPNEAKVILTVGHARKFVDGPKTSFPKVAEQIMRKDVNTFLICVGLNSPQSTSWRKLVHDFPGRVKFVPEVPREKLHDYIRSSDIGLDSFPMSGGTAILEMLSLGLPVFSLKCETGHFDPIARSSFYCSTVSELLRKVTEALGSTRHAYRERIREVLNDCQNSFGPEVWRDVLTSQAVDASFADAKSENNPEILDLSAYLVASTPQVAKYFF
jgi:hypothetical protein